MLTNETPLIIGTGADHVYWLAGEGTPRRSLECARPTFLARGRHGRYGVSEIGHGRVVKFGDDDAAPTAEIDSGGSFPCHIALHPNAPWAYVANYGDGVVRAVELTDSGFADVLDLPHAGSGPRLDRQERSHAHFCAVLGDHVVVADLGTDELRAYALTDGRPGTEPVVTRMPAGSGPRHFAGAGGRVHVAGELDGTVTVIDWDQAAGSGTVARSVAAATLPGDHYLSHIEIVEGYTVVAVRGSDTLSVLDADLDLVQEVSTGAWPRHFAVIPAPGGADPDLVGWVVVAAERADAVVWHELARTADGLRLSGLLHSVAVPTPMYVGCV